MAERERATTLYIWFNSIKQNAAGNREMKERERKGGRERGKGGERRLMNLRRLIGSSASHLNAGRGDGRKGRVTTLSRRLSLSIHCGSILISTQPDQGHNSANVTVFSH